MKVVVICSTSGSVFSKFFNDFTVTSEFLLVSDRNCGAIEFAKGNNINYVLYKTDSGFEFSNFLAKEFEGDKDTLFVSFYTRLFKGKFLDDHAGRIINFHPSVLPACRGQDGFGDTIASGARFVGSTVHLVDKGMDTGLPILQAVYPRDPSAEISQLRHRVFLQQVVSLAQVIDWFSDGRFIFNEKCVDIKGGEFLVGEFSPNLDKKYQQYFSKVVGCH